LQAGSLEQGPLDRPEAPFEAKERLARLRVQERKRDLVIFNLVA
jgi:hypothetical protein